LQSVDSAHRISRTPRNLPPRPCRADLGLYPCARGHGSQLECRKFEPIGLELLATSQRDPATIAKGQAALRACYDRLIREGVALSRYTLEDAADDVLELMRALQLRRVNLAATGADAISAYAVVREAPGAVRTLTLDSPYAPGTSIFSDPTAQLATAFDQYLALCRDNTNCARAYPNLAALARRAALKFKTNPVVVNAVLEGARARVRLDGDRAAKALANTLGDPRVLGVLAAAIANPPIDATATQAFGYDYYFLTPPHYPWAHSLSSWCSYDRYTLSPARSVSSGARPELAGVDDGLLEWQCAAWPVPKISESAFASFATDIPTMIVEGALNPYVAPHWESSLRRGLTNATTLTFPTISGRVLLYAPPCLNELRRKFLADPAQPLDTDACVRQSPPINFVTSTP
jgi:pimeloyl-ACP methyl ester carboxylesterase